MVAEPRPNRTCGLWGHEAAFGNSTGDQQMLEYTQAGDYTGHTEILAALSNKAPVDDVDAPRRAKREYAYGPAEGLPDTRIGTFTQALYDAAKKRGWMKE
jgi:hypothetical protein